MEVFCTKNDECCLKLMNFVFKMTNFVLKMMNPVFTNDELCIQKGRQETLLASSIQLLLLLPENVRDQTR